MRLDVLLGGLQWEVCCGTPDKDVEALIYHSDKAVPGSAFFAISGPDSDGKKYMEQAVLKGACVLITDGEDKETEELLLRLGAEYGVTAVRTENIRKALAHASAVFYRKPAEKLLLIGVTGTKGKTTTSFMIKEILEEAGIKTGIIGTVVSGFDGSYEEAENTTPQSEDIYRELRRMADNGCRAAVMEVSSQGLMQERVYGMQFDAAVFTNISPDHIGGKEHKSFEEYLFWKSMLFKQAKVAIINRDDPHWEYIARESTAERIVTFSAGPAGSGEALREDYCADSFSLIRDNGLPGVKFETCGHEIILGLPGAFNVSNAMGAAAAARTMGIQWPEITAALNRVRVRGRTERVDLKGDFTVLIDYAHNGRALESLLKALREYEPARLIAVFGCGGERDRNRRFEMGHAAARLADFSVITSDNPRREDPMAIIRDIVQAMSEAQGSYTVISDRREAILWTVSAAQTGDIIVVAGKGHETYQIIGEEKRHFDDREIVLSSESM